MRRVDVTGVRGMTPRSRPTMETTAGPSIDACRRSRRRCTSSGDNLEVPREPADFGFSARPQ